jgi:putative CocE/NonD family hydrolase
MRGRLRYAIAASLVILIGAGTALGIDLSRGSGSAATNLVNPSLFAQRSQYVTLSDSTKLAANVLLPTSASEPNHERVPTILRLTRYSLGWFQLDYVLRDAGFAIVNINERGTAASLGHLQQNADSYGADSADIIRWIVDQPWSDGNIATYGISNDGALAALASIYGGHPLKAVAPLFMSTDVYLDVAYPGGIFSEWFTKHWSDFVRAIDLQQPVQFSPSGVGTEQAGALANEAIREHLGNLNWYSTVKRMPFRGDWKTMSPPEIPAMIDRSGIPEYAIDGWWDNAFARGTIAQFLAGKGLGQLTIGPWNHGGSQSLDPLQPQLSGPEPFYSEFERLVAWLKARVRSAPDTAWRHIRYYVLGEEKWRTTDTWPPPGARTVKFSFAAGQRLAEPARSIRRTGVDRYPVWFGASSGPSSRWHTGLGGTPVSFDNRRSQDKRLLTYTSSPLAKATLITGTPSVSLDFSSTSKDAAVFIYLEAVAPGGKVAYLTEGELRASDRATSGVDALGPVHPFTREAARPLAGVPVDLEIGLLPIAARVPAGYRLRIAIAGADAGSFERVPAHGPATFTIGRGGSRGSFLSLPVMGRQ